jgi:hypothetical protein
MAGEFARLIEASTKLRVSKAEVISVFKGSPLFGDLGYVSELRSASCSDRIE